jgi:hypothetical protein
MTKFKPYREMTKGERAAFKQGIKFAAEIADNYNSSTTHPYRLGDCIQSKLNQLPTKKVKKNKQAKKTTRLLDGILLDHVTLEWCLGEVMRLPITERTFELSDRISNLLKIGKESHAYSLRR